MISKTKDSFSPFGGIKTQIKQLMVRQVLNPNRVM